MYRERHKDTSFCKMFMYTSNTLTNLLIPLILFIFICSLFVWKYRYSSLVEHVVMLWCCCVVVL